MSLHVDLYVVVYERNAKVNYRSQFFSPPMWVLGFKLQLSVFIHWAILLDHNAFKNCLLIYFLQIISFIISITSKSLFTGLEGWLVIIPTTLEKHSSFLSITHVRQLTDVCTSSFRQIQSLHSQMHILSTSYTQIIKKFKSKHTHTFMVKTLKMFSSLFIYI